MFVKKAISLVMVSCMVMTGVFFSVPDRVSAAENIEMTVSNLTVTPSTVDKGTYVDVAYQIDASYVGTEAGYFKNGQVSETETNIYDFFDGSTFTEDVHHAVTGEVIGEIKYEPGKVSITWNETAEGYRMTHYTGTFLVDHEFSAKDINDTTSPLTEDINIGNASTPVTWELKPINLIKIKSGKGTINPSTMANFTGDKISETVTLTPDSGETVTKVELRVANGTRKNITVPESGGTVTIEKSELAGGNNYLYVTFSGGGSTPVPPTPNPSDPTEYEQRTAGSSVETNITRKIRGDVIDNNYVPMTIIINQKALIDLFAYMDAPEEMPDNATMSYASIIDRLDASDMYFDFDRPGCGIYAVLPYYTYNQYGYPVPVNGQTDSKGWYRMADVTDMFARHDGAEGETYTQWYQELGRSRPSYGFFDYYGKQELNVYFNLSKNHSLKYSNLFARELSEDEVYQKAFGDSNATGGTVQTYLVKFYVDHSKQVYGGTYKNDITMYGSSMNGNQRNGTAGTTQYNIRRSHNRVQGNGGDFELYYSDEATGEGLSGAQFDLEKKDAGGDWQPYTYEGNPVSGITEEGDGYLMLHNLIPGDYRIVKKTVLLGYEGSVTTYKPGPGNKGTNMNENQFTVQSGATASVVMSITEKRNLPVNVFYDANEGSGSLIDENNPYQPGDRFTVMSPSNVIQRPGYYFTGWNYKRDGTGDTYAVGSTHSMGSEDITLYAQWSRNNQAELDSPSIKKTINVINTEPAEDTPFTFTIVPATNNPAEVTGLETSAEISGEGTVDKAFGTKLGFTEAGEYTFTVREVKGNAENYTYDSTEHQWKVKVRSGTYNYEIESNTIDGNTVEGSGVFGFINTYDKPVDVEKCTITYKLNGGNWKGDTSDIVETYPKETKIKIHDKPVREGFTFLYWEGSEFYPGDEYKVTEDHTFTAQWKENEAPNDPDDKDKDKDNTEKNNTDKNTTDKYTTGNDDPGDTDKDDPEKRSGSNTSADTGDEAGLVSMLALLFAAAGVLAEIGFRRRRGRNV